MKHRLLFIALLALLLAPASAQRFKEPAWFDQGVVFVGNWEPLNVRVRLGVDAVTGEELPANVAGLYQREHAEETVIKLKEAGVTMFIAHFYKTGLEADREDIEWTKKVAQLCHKHGLKVGTYIGDTIYAETMLRDMPEAVNWVLRMENGDPVRYNNQTFRYRADFNHPGYVEHMKKVIRIAVEEVKTDFIHFDNISRQSPPFTGDTQEINRRFRAFLQAKYSPAQLKARLGFSDIRGVKVPSWSGLANPGAIARITDPLVQEWIDFRCHDLADYYGKLAAYARQLNPNIVIESNPHGISTSNNAFLSGVDHARLVPHGSVFWTEESNPRVDNDGSVVTRIRSFKAARTLGNTVFARARFVNERAPGSPLRLRMSEAMAFNRNCIGDVGKPLDVFEITEEAKRYIGFYRAHNRYFAASKPVADVAVLRSFASMAYNSVDPYRETMLAEQVLIQHKVPFHIIFDQQLGDLKKYKVLVLAGQESLSDRALEQFREYVRAGGGLVATGQTSLFTDWRRVREDYGLADVLGIHLHPNRALPTEQRRTFGQGRVAYLPAAVPAGPAQPAAAPGRGGRGAPAAGGPSLWALPRNSAQILDAIKYAAGTPFAVEFDAAPLTTAMELTESDDGNTRTLHWLNYKVNAPVEPGEVTLALPPGKTVVRIEALSPDRDGVAQPLTFTTQDGRIRFRMPRLETYNLASVSFKR